MAAFERKKMVDFAHLLFYTFGMYLADLKVHLGFDFYLLRVGTQKEERAKRAETQSEQLCFLLVNLKMNCSTVTVTTEVSEGFK